MCASLLKCRNGQINITKQISWSFSSFDGGGRSFIKCKQNQHLNLNKAYNVFITLLIQALAKQNEAKAACFLTNINIFLYKIIFISYFFYKHWVGKHITNLTKITKHLINWTHTFTGNQKDTIYFIAVGTNHGPFHVCNQHTQVQGV